MQIDRAQLCAFVTVLREGSFDGAARILHVTAPAISQRVRQLEERLGQVLIKRGTPCVATEAGAELARHAEQIDMLEAETLQALACLQGPSGLDGDPHATGGAAPPVRIPVVVNADSLDTWFMAVPNAVASAQDDGPAIVLHIQVDDQDHTTALLRDGSVIGAVTAEPQPVQGCTATPLGVMRYIAVAAPEFHRRWLTVLETPGPDIDSWAALSCAPFIQFNKKDALHARFLTSWVPAAPGDAMSVAADMLRKSADQTRDAAGAMASRLKHSTPGSRAAPCYRIPTTSSFIEALRLGLGWGMLPIQMAAPLIADGILRQITRSERDDGVDVPLYWQRWALRSPVLQRLSSAVERIAGTVLEPWAPDELHTRAPSRSASGTALTPPAVR